MVFKKAIHNQAAFTKQVNFKHELSAFLRELMNFSVNVWYLVIRVQ